MAREDLQGVREVTVKDSDGKILECFDFAMAGIRSVKGMIQGLWSLNPFSQALSGRNGFSDIDAHTEICGHSLTLEFKQSFQSLNQGQVLKAIRQAKFQHTTTFFIEGETDSPKKWFYIYSLGGGEYLVSDVRSGDISTIKEAITAWEAKARKNSLVEYGGKTAEWQATNEIIAKARARD